MTRTTTGTQWEVEAVHFTGTDKLAGYRAVRYLGHGRSQYLSRSGETLGMGEAASRHELELSADLVPTEAVAQGMISRWLRESR